MQRFTQDLFGNTLRQVDIDGIHEDDNVRPAEVPMEDQC